MAAKETDAISGVETTGHEWDGIKELNNPLPRWWVWTFYATIVFSIGYMIYYPAIPLISSATKGIGGYSSRAVVADQMAQAQLAQKQFLDQIASTPVSEIAANEELHRFAVSAGRSAFKVHCVQCHGSGAQGSPGYPNLNDDDWIWGGDVETIYTTISHGVRSDLDDDTRISEMSAFGADEILSHDEIVSVASYVMKLAGKEHDEARAADGEQIFADNCAACHGEDGTGSRELGAPNLTDAIWLYGGTEQEVVAQVNRPRHGVMPAWLGRLGDVTVKQLAVYVHDLGGGEDNPAQ